MPRNILIATGGTGGHIYPAMALAQKLKKENPEMRVLFVGGGLSQNRYFDQSTFDFRSVDCGTFTKKSPISLCQSTWRILKGIQQSRAIIKEFKPDLAVGFGSYYSFPPLAAAKLCSIPFILHEANSIPGKVNRFLAPFASAVGVHFPLTLQLIKGNAFEVGMPLRRGYELGAISKEEARRHFGLFEKKITCLVFGGSQGARFINKNVSEALRFVKDPGQLQLIHIAGHQENVQDLENFYKNYGVAACVKPFEKSMELAWQAADFAICRAGASSIAEQLEFEVPGVLVPFPQAADDHQNLNADFLTDTVGGAVKIQEKDFEAPALAEIIQSFLENDSMLLELKKTAMKSYKKKTRAKDLYTLVIQTLKK